MKASFTLNILITIILWLSHGLLAAQSSEWKLKKESDGMKIYLRETNDSDIKQVRIETVFDASLSTIVSVLRDVPSYTEWIYKCTKAERLGEPGSSSGKYYCEIDFPWPMSDRDFIAAGKVRQDPATRHVFIEVNAYPEALEEKDGIVRIRHMHINYEFIPLPDNKVKMEYELHSDPGGSIPAWLANMFVDNGPANTIRGIRRMISKEKYRTAQLSYIKD